MQKIKENDIKLKEVINKKMIFIREEMENYKFIIKPCIILFFILVIGMSAILRSNFYYIDDMGRADTGYKGWEVFSRYTSYHLSTFIHGSKYLTDISPLPQLIAMALIAVSSVILLHVITNKKKFSLLELLATIPLGLSPYFLECISYKFDSAYMALSIFSAIVPLLFYKKGYVKYTFITIIGMIIVCTTYQPSTGIFPMLVVLIAMKLWNEKTENKEILKFIMTSILGYCIGMILFRIFIMHPVDTYVGSSIIPLNKIIPVTIEHFKEYFTLIRSDFKSNWLLITAFMCISYVFVMVLESKRKKLIALVVSIIAICVMPLFSFGIYPLLENTLYQPRAMYGFGVFIAFIGASICTSKKAYLPKIACLVLSWLFFVFAFTYGNALDVQNKYTDKRVQAVIEDLDDLEILSSKEKVKVQIKGSIGLAYGIENMSKGYGMINRLIPATFLGEWDWGVYRFFYYPKVKEILEETKEDLSKYNLPILKENIYHTIKGNEKYILIELK